MVFRAVGLCVVVEGEAQAVVQHLSVDRLSRRPPRRDRVQCLLSADVREVDGRARVLGEGRDSPHRELLAPVRVHEVRIAELRPSLAAEPRLHVLDQIVVLGVHHRHRAEPSAFLQQRSRRAVVEPDPGLAWS